MGRSLAWPPRAHPVDDEADAGSRRGDGMFWRSIVGSSGGASSSSDRTVRVEVDHARPAGATVGLNTVVELRTSSG